MEPMSTPPPINPLAEGLVYTTVVQTGRMLHIGKYHLLVANYVSGDVAAYGWDEVMMALAALELKQAAPPAPAKPVSIFAAKPQSHLARFMANRP
jgi:hypothetical protein